MINYYGDPLQAIAVNINLFLFFNVFGLNKIIKNNVTLSLKLLKVLLFPIFAFCSTFLNLVGLIFNKFLKNSNYPLGYITVLNKQD